MKKKISIALLLFLFLVACAEQRQTQIQSTQIDIGTPNRISTSLPIQELVLTPTSSKTFEPQFLTAKANSEAYMIEREATNAYFQTFCGNGLFLDWDAITNDVSDWTVINCHSADWSMRYQKFIYKDKEKIWTIGLVNKDLFVLRDRFDLSLAAEHWSKDGKYLYLFPSYSLRNGSIDGWSPNMIFEYKTGLYRLNLETGDFEALLNPNSIPGHEVSYKLSPDERFLAFASESEKNIFYIQDIKTRLTKKFELSLNIENVGDFVWTPDGKKLILAAGLQGWYDNKAGTSLYLFDSQTSSINVLLYNDREQRVPSLEWDLKSYWLKENVLYLISAQDGFTDWSFDIHTGLVAPISTTTPEP